MNSIYQLMITALLLGSSPVLSKDKHTGFQQSALNQKNGSLYVVRSHGKEYILTHSTEKDSTIKKEWLSNVFVVKELNKTKYKDIPEAKNGVIVFVINDKKFPDALDSIKKRGAKELSSNRK